MKKKSKKSLSMNHVVDRIDDIRNTMNNLFESFFLRKMVSEPPFSEEMQNAFDLAESVMAELNFLQIDFEERGIMPERMRLAGDTTPMAGVFFDLSKYVKNDALEASSDE